MNIRSSAMRALVRCLFGSSDVEGQGLVEYSMIILFVVIACVAVVTEFQATMDRLFWSVIRTMP
jgi:Flp pilus assembly pilin Flp